MIGTVGIRKETKDKTQRRAPLSPAHVRTLVREHGITVVVEPWEGRIFPDAEYRRAGAVLSADLEECNVVFGIKELAARDVAPGATHAFFSHTVKGQAYNMRLLRTLLDRRNTLFDYERVRDADGRRLVFFGDYAGYAGMIDTVWALGRRLLWEGWRTPFADVTYATEYPRLVDAARAFRVAGTRIRRHGLPGALVPLVCGFTGDGHVATAARRMFDFLPVVDVSPDNLPSLFRSGGASNRVVYAVRFRKHDLYRPLRSGAAFDAAEFRAHPEGYVSHFERSVPYLTTIVNGIYWHPRSPRILTTRFLGTLYRRKARPRLRVIGDITCDIDGSVECTVKATDSSNPVFVYDPVAGAVRDGWEGNGPVILAVDKLPTELPREASEAFGRALLPFVPPLAAADFSRPARALRIPEEFARALVVHRGALGPGYTYLRESLRAAGYP